MFVIPAKAGIQTNSWMPVEDPVFGGDQVRHDGVGLFSCQVNIINRPPPRGFCIGILIIFPHVVNGLSGHDMVLLPALTDDFFGEKRMATMVGETEAALRERVKELSCLYGIAQIAGKPGLSLEEIFQQIVELLPPAWQYPDILEGRVILDGNVFATAGFGKMRISSVRKSLYREIFAARSKWFTWLQNPNWMKARF